MKAGWYQIGFLNDFEEELNIINGCGQPVIAVNRNDKIELFDAACPHRGAHLGYGGELCGNEIVCPFHGCRIGLDEMSEEGYLLNKRPLLQVDSLLFTKERESKQDAGLENYLKALSETHVIIPGFTIQAKVMAEMVIENAFDQMHFRTVHKILNEPLFEIRSADDKMYRVTGSFDLPPSPWQSKMTGKDSVAETISVPYEAVAFSPFVVISNLGGTRPYHIITSAQQVNKTEAAIRLSIGIKNESFDTGEIELYRSLIEQSHKGLEKDCRIWENMIPEAVSRFQKREKSVIGFRKFCKEFIKENT